MATSSSSAFVPVSLSPSQASRLEALMKQQVQDAIRARTDQRSKGNTLDSDWRFVGSLDRLKTFKHRGADSFNSTSSWATTLERSTRATACNVSDRISTSGRHTWNVQGRSSSRTRSRMGRLSFSRRTVGATGDRQAPLDAHPPLRSFRTFGSVQGNYRDIVDVHYAANSADFVQQQQLLSPVVIDGAVLRTIRATKDSYVGIKWLAENSFAGMRDVCFVEMVGYTTNANGQEIGVVATASVDVPECPELSRSMKLTRVRMKRTMLVIPSSDTPKVTSEVFVMGSSEASESSIVSHAQYRLNMAVLNDISLVIDSKNIAKQTLALQENWVPDEKRESCSICSRKFHFVGRRRHHCRLCGDVVCKTCYVTRSVPGTNMENSSGCKPGDASAICQTKFCVRCVMGLRAMDKRLDKFSQQISKMLSLNVDTWNVSETAAEHESSSRSGSSVTFFKRGTNKKHTIDLDQLYKFSTPSHWSAEQSEETTVSARSTVAGAVVSHDSGESKHLRPSLSIDPAHSNSYSKLRVFSRHSSTASLGSEPDFFEEKVRLNIDKASHIVAI